MALSAEQIAKYGLAKSKAQAANLDKGLVEGPSGNIYEIKGFKHGQEDGLDKDKGASFSTSLAADAKAAGFDPSNFNTAGDVQNAINAIGGASAPEEEATTPGFDNLSREAAKAFAYTDAFEDRADGLMDYTMTDVRFGDKETQEAAAQEFADAYKSNIIERMGGKAEEEEEVQPRDVFDIGLDDLKIEKEAEVE